MKRYISLTENILYMVRGSFSSNTHIEIQVKSIGNGYFNMVFSDGYKYISGVKVLRIDDVKRQLRAFKSLQ
jgi:hypothetical protein